MTTSTINPAIPTTGGTLSSSDIRANWTAAVHDINTLYTLVGQISPSGIVYSNGSSYNATTIAAPLLLSGSSLGLASQAASTVLGNAGTVSAVPSALTTTQLTALLNRFTTSLQGAVPASGGGTANFLRADGSFAAPNGVVTAGANTSVTGTNTINVTGALLTEGGTSSKISALTTASNPPPSGSGSTLEYLPILGADGANYIVSISNLLIAPNAAASSGLAGPSINITGGVGDSGHNSGSISITGGASPAATGGTGGSILVTGGVANAGPGGSVTIASGAGSGSHAAGSVNINGGAGAASGGGGPGGVTITPGSALSGSGAGGSVVINTGTGSSSGGGGAFTVTTVQGGSISLTGGVGISGGGGGAITLTTGNSGSSNHGGDLTVVLGTGSSARNGQLIWAAPTSDPSVTNAIYASNGYLVVSGNTGPLIGTTGTIGGSTLSAGGVASGTVAITGATTLMAVAVSPQTYPGDGFVWDGYVSSAGTVTVKVVAAAAGTPTGSLFNVRVLP